MQRIPTLVEVSLADHNYLFGLPSMLDAQPIPGKTTSSWILKYGQTLEGCKAGPWMNSVFKGNIVYLHILDWKKEGILLPSIPCKLVAAKSITGNVKVIQDEQGLMLTGTPDPINTIVRLEFDASVEDIAYALPSKGSFTIGHERTLMTNTDGRLTAEVDLGAEKNIKRFEFTIDNLGHLRGQGRPFELQVKTDGTWKTVYQGNVFGIICSKMIDPITTKAVRLIVQATGIRQLDLF